MSKLYLFSRWWVWTYRLTGSWSPRVRTTELSNSGCLSDEDEDQVAKKKSSSSSKSQNKLLLSHPEKQMEKLNVLWFFPFFIQ